ncbi:MAG: type III-A CRISPR-associated RAMP protein Csm5 [Bacteroidales bacterium]|nr:type III-A CRISPR-associated RAMP protein Csm5 [Bacteroidales bacterium]
MTYKALITTLTPVHIGNGVKYKHKVEFFSDNKYVYIIDPEKILALIGQQGIESWVKAINDGVAIKEFLKNRQFDIEKIIVKKCPLANQIKKDKELHEQIYNPLLGPYIPGSSIKGAIKTAILDFLTDNSTNLQNIELNDIRLEEENENGNIKIEWKDEIIDKKLFGQDANHKSTRFIKVGDAYFINTKTKIYFTQALNAEGNADNGKWKFNGSISNLYETIPENSKALFQFSIDQNLFKLNEKYESVKWTNIETRFLTDNLVHIINNATKSALEKELKYFESYSDIVSNDKGKEKYLTYLQKIREEFDKLSDNEFIIRVGANSGYNFMTLRWMDKLDFFQPTRSNPYYLELRKAIQKNRNRKNYSAEYIWPRTRKITTTGIPFGFIKISPINSDEEYLQIKKQLETKANDLQQIHIEKLNNTTDVSIHFKTEVVPQAYKGKIEQGIKVPAVVIKPGKPNIVKLLIENNEITISLNGYASELPEHKYIYVKITEFSKGQIRRVNFLSEVKE